MANGTQKRRAAKGKPPQSAKTANNKKRNINWMRIALIVLGLIIVVSMILSLFIVPGSQGGF